MAKVYGSLTELIGNTPLLEVKNIEKKENLPARMLVKMESFNPGGSVKDRVAYSMIEDAERRGALKPGGMIIEPTSGNTGIGIAWVGRLKGYETVLCMPETMSVERRQLLKAMGARVVLTPGGEGMKGSIAKAEELKGANPGSVILSQFDNKSNPEVHEKTTAEEIWRDTDGRVDVFVAGVGTGGTVSGTSRGLKRHNPALRAVAVEPSGSAVLSGGKPGPHRIQGIGAGFVPGNYDADAVDEVVTVTDEEAVEGARMLAREEGLLAGVSAGAVFRAALREARKQENSGKTVVALLPDTGERYMSTGLFDGE